MAELKCKLRSSDLQLNLLATLLHQFTDYLLSMLHEHFTVFQYFTFLKGWWYFNIMTSSNAVHGMLLSLWAGNMLQPEIHLK